MLQTARASSANLRQVDRRLIEWGRWRVTSIIGGMGYASQSTLVTALQGSRSTAKYYPRDNSFAEEINNVINNLSLFFPELYRIIYLEYTVSGNRADKLIDFNIPRTTYMRRLIKAKTWIDKRLNS